jgi:hypothetical protein
MQYNSFDHFFNYPKTHNFYRLVMLLKVKYAKVFLKDLILASSNISKTLGQFIPHHTSLEFSHSVTKSGSYWHAIKCSILLLLVL